jgi:diaminohydroxyphosphoribosylaminopyrimidine deaminase/5-amino-6-(5-phosphoribosylamino)uracil reductase
MACTDPFEAVAGRGATMLREAGIDVVEGVRRAEAETLNAGFFTRLRTGLPLIARDLRPALFDADLGIHPGESEADALARLGARGLTRVRRL